MVSKDEVMRILDLENADFDTIEGVSELQKRVEQAIGLFTHKNFVETTDSFTGENADNPLNVLEKLDSILEEKRTILKHAECDLKPIAWHEIQEVKREWLIPHWLPANTVTMFTGQGGTGKSWLTLQVACEIASHAESGAWGDNSYTVPEKAEYDDGMHTDPKHIVCATYEDEPAEIKRRLNALTSSFDWIASERKIIEEHLHIVDMRGVGSIWGPGLEKHISVTGELLRTGEALRKVCEDIGARLLILDPLSGAFGGNENDRTAVYDFVSSFRGWGDAAKCAMLVIGHLPKGAEGRAAGFSGSTAWEASARAMWLIGTKVRDEDEGKSKRKHGDQSEDEKTYYALQHTKSNYTRLQKEVPLAKNQYGWWSKVENVDEAKEAYRKYYDAQEESDAETDIPNF